MKDFKYTSLTHILKHDAWMTLPRLRHVLDNFDVSPNLGGLPPALCACVAPENRAMATMRFHELIAEFITCNRLKLLSFKTVMTCPWPSVSQLFGTSCILECRNRAVGENMPWRGAIATVCRVSFPELNAAYALKVFRMDNYRSAHGPWYEIPAAFGAVAAERRDNNPVRMASLGDVKYMLSDWADDDKCPTGTIRENKNEIFTTVDMEMHDGNFRGGRRIDYGRTHRTVYGAASYNVRKLYRKLIFAAQSCDNNAVQNIMKNQDSAFAQRDVDRAIEMVHSIGPINVREFVNRCRGVVR